MLIYYIFLYNILHITLYIHIYKYTYVHIQNVISTIFTPIFRNFSSGILSKTFETQWQSTPRIINERKAVTIPPKFNPMCQPCDVYFYRQVKDVVKIIQHASDLLRGQREISSREDAIKIHSLTHHPLSARVFEKMIEYTWFSSKLTSNRPSFQNVNEICFPLSLIKRKCNCNGVPFIRCAWCGLPLCFK